MKNQPNDVPARAWITEELDELLTKRAEKLRMSKSALIREYLQRSIRRTVTEDFRDFFDVA